MKLYCDYCGTQIDTEIHANCPNCGGSYMNDEELRNELEKQRRLDALQLRQNELKTDFMELENERIRRELDRKKPLNRKDKKVLLFTVIIMIVIACGVMGRTSNRNAAGARSSAVSVGEQSMEVLKT